MMYLLVAVLGLGILILGGLVVFLLVHKKKSSCNKCPPGGLKKWIDFSKNAKKYVSDDDSKKKYNSFCKNPTNDNWIKAFGVQGDPHTNGFYDFSRDCTKCPNCPTQKCPTQKCPTQNSDCMLTNEQFIRITQNKDQDPNTNGYKKFCELNYAGCILTNEEWMSVTGKTNQDPYTNGYNNFCKIHQGTKNCPACRVTNEEWVQLNNLRETNPQKNGYTDFCLASDGTKRDWDKWSGLPVDPKYTKYNKFCQTPGAGGGGT